jgi:4-hydroxy-tetrahydrodipicolinate reductase
VIGASGLSSAQQQEVAAACKKAGLGGILVPNFAIGAVLMMRFAAEAAKWLPNAEVIEMHHDKKVDAPSGTGIRTAELVSEARRSGRHPDPTKVVKFEGARGSLVNDVPVHSVRLPGLVAHQTVMFGGEGEVLTIHHDSMNRLSFMSGVLLAVRRVRDLDGFVVGLDALMF